MTGSRFSCEVEAVFGDLDAMGHVNNVVHLRWMETARIAYWIQVTGQSAEKGLPPIDIILARTEIDYRSPVAYGEKISVQVRTSLIKRSSLVLDYALVARADGRSVAEAKTIVVCYDYELKRSKPVPEETKAGILALDQDARMEI